MPSRVFVVHPTPLTILSIKTVIQANAQLEYIGASHAPMWLEDDINMLVVNVTPTHMDWVRTLTAREAPIGVLMMSDTHDASLVAEAIRAGAMGYISTQCAPTELAEAMVSVAYGHNYIGEEFASLLYASYALAKPVTLLTPRQQTILTLLAKGLSNQQIGEVCAISPHTVRNHIAAIYRQLNVSNRAGALTRAVQLDLISISPSTDGRP